jgi:uncharacterized protein (DUF305 family)
MHHSSPTPAVPSKENVHAAHQHDIGPAGETYDLRYIDAMVKHHEGALLMSEFVFDIGSPGVGALANEIWDDQAQEIKAMGQWGNGVRRGIPRHLSIQLLTYQEETLTP